MLFKKTYNLKRLEDIIFNFFGLLIFPIIEEEFNFFYFLGELN